MISKRAVTWVILALMLAISFIRFNGSASTDGLSEPPYVSNQVIVRFKDAISSKQIGATENFGGIVIDHIDALNLVLVEIAEERISAFTDNLQRRGLVEYVERNYVDTPLFVPSDPDWDRQWNMPIIEADRAWDSENGSDTVLVAVVDSGVDYDHPDLADNYQPGGHDWSNSDDDPYPDAFYEYRDHGTHCAGIVAAVLDNGIGVAGLAQVRILAEKVFGTGPGSGSHFSMAQAFEHATDLGARVISYSAGGFHSETKYDAVKYAYDSDVLIVAAAGNDNTNNPDSGDGAYPAAYDEVVSVAATNINDERAGYSNWGDWIEISAPGGDGDAQVYSTIVDDYGYMYGTSMATPHVSGVAALIWSQFPEYGRDQVRSLLLSSADDLGDPGWDEYYGYGRVNAYRAVEQPSITFATNPTSFIDSAGTITLEGGTYSDSQSDSFSLGNHTATANAPTDYTLFFWSYSGSPGSGVYVPDTSENPTTVQVYGDGWLKAVFAAKVTFYTNPSNVGGIRWGSSSDPSHPNGDSIYDEALPPDYSNQIDVYADVPNGYKFESWNCTGGLSPSTTSDPHTIVTFTGPGTITTHFIYDANITAYCVTEEQEASVSFIWDGTDFYSTPHLFTDLSGSHGILVAQNDEGGHPFIRWVKDGVDYSTDRAITISNGGNYTALYAEKYEIRLESMEQDTGTTTNLGSIVFDAATDTLPKNISKEGGTYQATYDPVFGYRFDHWETSGGVSVAEAYAQTTMVTVGGDGALRANYTANIPPTTPSVTFPNGDEILSGAYDITWTASTDADGDPITYDIQFSTDDGTTWLDLASGIPGIWYSWDTATFPDSVNYLVRVIACDGELYSEWDESNSVFTVDNTPPLTTHSLDGTIGQGDWWNSSVQVTLSASDITSGVDYTDYEIDDDLSRYVSPFMVSGDGFHTVEYCSVDKAGNTESVRSVEISIDTTPPEGSITIADGAEYATSTSVTLSLIYSDTTSGVYQVRYSNDGVWDTEAWESPAPTKAWTLTLGDGTKTVYYQVRDDAGWDSFTYSDTIILDTLPPTGSVSINDGAPYTNSTSVTLTLSTTDAVAEMCFSNDNVTFTDWEPYDTSKPWTLPVGDGEKTVSVNFKDNAGLISSCSDTVILDTTPPTITDHTPTESDVTTTITVTFSESMNQASAESAFSVDPPVSGSFSWSGDSLIFTPSSNLEYDTTYSVTIGTKAEDLAGNHLQSPYSWQFTTSPATITITRLRTNRRIYTAGQNIRIYAWIEEDGSPLTEGTVTTRVYAKGKPSVLLATLAMNYNPVIGRWEATYGPLPGHEDPNGYQGTYAIKVTAKHPPATKASKVIRCFVADRRRQGAEARFTRAVSPSIVPANQDFMVNVAIKNPSNEAQVLTVKLILPSDVNLIGGQLQQDITLGAGEKTTLQWTLESTTATTQLMKINVLKGGSVVAKLHWYIRAEPTSPPSTLATVAIMREHQAKPREDNQQRRAQKS